MELSPSEIRYSQDSITNYFSCGVLMTATFARLLAGDISYKSLPLIECAQKDGNWYAVSGNRRLHLYKKLQQVGKIRTIKVLIADAPRNFTTRCGGKHVRCRRGNLNSDLNQIISEWKRGKNIVAWWGKGVTRPRGSYDSYDYFSDDPGDDYGR